MQAAVWQIDFLKAIELSAFQLEKFMEQTLRTVRVKSFDNPTISSILDDIFQPQNRLNKICENGKCPPQKLFILFTHLFSSSFIASLKNHKVYGINKGRLKECTRCS